MAVNQQQPLPMASIQQTVPMAPIMNPYMIPPINPIMMTGIQQPAGVPLGSVGYQAPIQPSGF